MITDKDAKEWQKMVEKLEKQSKKDKEKQEDQDEKVLDKTDKEWYNNNMKKFIDPKNPNTVGKSLLNLGNHILVICFILALLFVVKASYS